MGKSNREFSCCFAKCVCRLFAFFCQAEGGIRDPLVTGVQTCALPIYEHFAVPALTPVFWNLAIILGLVIGVPQAHTTSSKLYVYAVAILIGTLIQVLLPIPWLRGRDDRLRVVIDIHDPAVKRVFLLMLPVTLSLGLINFNAVVDTLFASRLIDPQLAP